MAHLSELALGAGSRLSSLRNMDKKEQQIEIHMSFSNG
jgi:hypothetical protein